MTYAILIPCYQPEESLVGLVKKLRGQLHADLFIVNDGSEVRYDPIFQSLTNDGATVITYRKNHGKGYALRTGIRSICRSDRHYSYIITADADSQHSPEDIARIAAAAKRTSATATESTDRCAPLILGVRALDGPSVPLRSRIGNHFSSAYFKFVTGITLRDTQTGLRGIPARLFDLAIKTPGDHYDYEMNFLLAAAGQKPADQNPVLTVPIQAVYADGNARSHFRTVVDSVRIYKTPLRYLAASLLCAAVDLTLFTIFASMFGSLASGILAATALARIVSGIVNFTLNRRWSFASIRAADGGLWGQALRYLILFIGQMLASSGLVTLLSFLPIPITLVKILVDVTLAFASFYIQHHWVFRNSGNSRKPGIGALAIFRNSRHSGNSGSSRNSREGTPPQPKPEQRFSDSMGFMGSMGSVGSVGSVGHTGFVLRFEYSGDTNDAGYTGSKRKAP